ncbi:MAG TPA: hypothetical protein VK957_21725 [Lunatimonas sp.]|nr:hypothetical protein [Lunatimonas sp.]
MKKQIFINLSVKDVEKSTDFYAQLGFSNNPEFTDDHQKCMVWSEQIYVMLISREKFNQYSRKEIGETNNNPNATYTLPVESLDTVCEIVEAGLKAGGKEPIPMIDEGYMQVRRIEDFDGHTWDFIFLDMDRFRESRY